MPPRGTCSYVHTPCTEPPIRAHREAHRHNTRMRRTCSPETRCERVPLSPPTYSHSCRDCMRFVCPLVRSSLVGLLICSLARLLVRPRASLYLADISEVVSAPRVLLPIRLRGRLLAGKSSDSQRIALATVFPADDGARLLRAIGMQVSTHAYVHTHSRQVQRAG